MNKLLLGLLIVACALLVSTVGPSATVSAEQKGHSPIYSFDVMHEGEVAGEVKVNTAKKTPSYVLRADGLTPNTNYMFWYQGASAEDLYLLGSQGTTKSGRLSMHGTFPDASIDDLQAAQFLLTEPGLAALSQSTSSLRRAPHIAWRSRATVTSMPGARVAICSAGRTPK